MSIKLCASVKMAKNVRLSRLISAFDVGYNKWNVLTLNIVKGVIYVFKLRILLQK